MNTSDQLAAHLAVGRAGLGEEGQLQELPDAREGGARLRAAAPHERRQHREGAGPAAHHLFRVLWKDVEGRGI